MSLRDNRRYWALEKYAQWKNNNWKEIKIDEQSCYVIISNCQLLVVYKGEALESLSLITNAKIESYFTNASIVIKVTNQLGRTSKFKILFANGYGNKTNIENCLEVVGELRKFISVVHHSSHHLATKKFTEKVEKKLHIANQSKDDLQLSITDGITEEFVRMFLLDPTSPALVNKISHFFQQ